MKFLLRLLPFIFIGSSFAQAESAAFQATSCEGSYPRHLQGICTNGKDAIFWSWTDNLVKTDLKGHILQQKKVASHHGDLCFHDGRLYVAVNLGKFDLPAGSEDSWVYVYDPSTLEELARHRVPELVHGAGGIGYHDGKFIVVGGLPEGAQENYLYEYDADFKFQKRHVLPGYTLMGIQTIAYADGAWWLGCYGKPKVLLRTDESFQLTGKWEADASLGIVSIGQGRFLLGRNTITQGVGHQGQVIQARADEKKGLVLEPASPP